MKRATVFAAIGLSTTSFAGQAFSQNADGWTSLTKASIANGPMAGAGKMPAAIDCRAKAGTTGNMAIEVRIRWAPNPDRRQWKWRAWDAETIERNDRFNRGSGYRRVAYKIFEVDGSDAKRGCAVWHK